MKRRNDNHSPGEDPIFFMQTAKTLIRAKVILLVLSCGGSLIFIVIVNFGKSVMFHCFLFFFANQRTLSETVEI